MKVARFLRLVDDDGALSLTHLAVYISFACVLAGRSVSWAEWATFLAAMASYRVKRYLEQPGADSETIAALGQSVTQLQADFRKLNSPERLAGLRDGLRPK